MKYEDIKQQIKFGCVVYKKPFSKAARLCWKNGKPYPGGLITTQQLERLKKERVILMTKEERDAYREALKIAEEVVAEKYPEFTPENYDEATAYQDEIFDYWYKIYSGGGKRHADTQPAA